MRLLACAALLAALWMAPAAAQDTRFAYVGVLQDGANAAPTGSYDVRVRLFDGPDGNAAELAAESLHAAVPVEAGIFSLALDFDNAVLAPEAWLELAVRPAGSGSFEVLAPRQRLHGVPTALYAESTDWSGVANKPAGFADGVDDDALAALGCSDGQVPLHSASGWTCGTPPQGEDGLSVLSGFGSPSPALGRDGEFYIDTAVHAIHGPKAAGDWGPATSLIGPPGGDSGAGGELEPMGTVKLTVDGQSQSIPLLGFSLSLRRLVNFRFSGSTIEEGPPTVERLELLLAPSDFGAGVLQIANTREPMTVLLRLEPGARLLLEASDALAIDTSVEPLTGSTKGALMKLALDPAALTLHWDGDSFSWTFRTGTGESIGDPAKAACRDLFQQFGSNAPDDFEGIALASTPVPLRLFLDGYDAATNPGIFRVAPLELEFPLETPSGSPVSRPTCAANLLAPGHGRGGNTTVAVFRTRSTPDWSVNWTGAVAESMAITGANGEVGIAVRLLASEPVCHAFPEGGSYCVEPFPAASDTR